MADINMIPDARGEFPRSVNHELSIKLDYGTELQCLGGGLHSPSASSFTFNLKAFLFKLQFVIEFKPIAKP